ncbi:MAG: MFS transporter [Bacillota bacterium]
MGRREWSISGRSNASGCTPGAKEGVPTAAEGAQRHYLILCTLLFWVSLYLYVPVLPSFTERLGGTLRTVGVVISLYGLTQLILRIPLGILSDRLGRRKPFVVMGFWISALSALGMGLSRGTASLGFFRGLSGVAATMWVAFTILYASFFGADGSAKAMGQLSSGMSVGQMLATSAGGYLAQEYGVRFPFLTAGFVALAGGVAILLVRETPLPVGRPPFLVQIGRLKTPTLLVPSILAALCQYGTWVTAFGFTPIWADRLGASDAQLGLLSLLALLPQAVAALIIGSGNLGRLKPWRVVTAGFGLSTLAIGILPVTGDMLSLYLVQALGGFGRGMVMPSLMALAIRSAREEERASWMGVFQAVYGLGMFLGPALSGFLGEWLQLNGVFLITGVLTALSAWVAHRYGRGLNYES